MTVNFTVSGQELSLTKVITAEYSVNYITAHVDFSSEWDGLTNFIHFYKGDEIYSFELDENGDLTADQGCNLAGGLWHVYIHGDEYVDLEDGTVEAITRCTSTEVLFYVQVNGINGEGAFPEIADISEQLIEQAQAYLTQAQELRAGIESLRDEIFTKTYTWNDLKGVHDDG